jgi:aldose 1-epimerase
MALRLLPQPGYPFALGIRLRYDLDAGGLTVTTSATNLGDRAAPYGCGAHPYLTVGTPLVDDAVLHLPARSRLPDDAAQGRSDGLPVEATALDFGSPRRLRDLRLDHTFADLQRDADGRAEVVLSAPEAGRRVVLWVDGGYRYLQVFTGDTLARVDRRRQGLAVEPMSCPPEALRTGTDLLRLEPGASVTHRWGLTAA